MAVPPDAMTGSTVGVSPARFSLADVLAEHGRSRPLSPALVDGATRLTYAELDARVGHLAAGLAGHGVGRGDRILWLGQNSFRVLEVLLAAARLGAVVCPANWRQSADELAFMLQDLEPAVVLWQELELGELVRDVRARDAARALWLQHDGDGADGYEALVAGGREPAQQCAVISQDPVLGLYTVAADGRSQAALLSHAGLIAQGMVISHTHEVTDAAVCLDSAPFFHVASFMLAIATLVRGGVNVVTRRADAVAMCEAIDRERCTHALIFPPTLDAMRDVALGGRYDLSTLWSTPDLSDRPTTMLTPLSAPWARRPGGYGQTEVGGLVTFNALGPPGEGGFGRPSPVTAIRIVDEHDEAVATGDVGEITIRGLTVMTGYHRRAELNALRSRGGWHHTGDLGRRHTDGTLTFVGPKTRMIKSGAENVYPTEVESCVAAHPAVAAVCVIGVPDPRWTQTVRAVVVLSGAVTEAELIEHCRRRIASYKKPRSVVFTDALPRTPRGDVDRDAVDTRFGGGGYPGAG
jgi:acyl-CoA synthetase (AMP-forming)/AMP-acid ligase II